MDPSLVDWTKKSVKTLLKEEGFHDRFIDEFVMGAMRMNYGQTTEAHGLVGMLSFLSLYFKVGFLETSKTGYKS